MVKKVLFVCVENACRSQMAEGFANYCGEGKIIAFSAGSKPAATVNPLAVQVMKEKGIDISGAVPKSFSELPKEVFDYVVMMGCADVCPIIPAKEEISWVIPDPKKQSIDVFRKVCDLIENKVKQLLKQVDTEK